MRTHLTVARRRRSLSLGRAARVQVLPALSGPSGPWSTGRRVSSTWPKERTHSGRRRRPTCELVCSARRPTCEPVCSAAKNSLFLQLNQTNFL